MNGQVATRLFNTRQLWHSSEYFGTCPPAWQEENEVVNDLSKTSQEHEAN